MDDLIAFVLIFVFWLLGTLRTFQWLFRKYIWPRLAARYGNGNSINSILIKKKKLGRPKGSKNKPKEEGSL